MRLTILALMVILACGTLHAVSFGQPDNGAHPWVGTLLFQAGDGFFYSCSGTLLAPKVMVTAAHCTIDAGIKNLHTWVKFDQSISLTQLSAAYLDNPRNGWIKAADVIPNPYYRGTYPNTYDVGIVLLEKPVTMSTYGALPPLNFLRSISGAKDNIFTVVGYGMQGYLKPFQMDRYERWVGNVRLVELNSAFDGSDMSAKFTDNPGKTSGGSCYGDSGGPIFYSNTNMVTAVVSWGITPCIGVDYDFRLDTAVAQDFVRSYLP